MIPAPRVGWIGAAVAVLLLAASAPPETVSFPDRWTPEVGARWSEEQRSHMTGHTRVRVGPAKVRDRADDDGVRWSAAVEVTEIEDGELSGFGLVFSEALRIEAGEQIDVGLGGAAVTGSGAPKRKWRTAEGKRLRKKARDFLDEQFTVRGDEDPIQLLLPAGPVAVGEAWDMDMGVVLDLLGRDRLTLDDAQTHGRCTLESVEERRGMRYGRIAFDVVIVPATITDGDFDEARMHVRGAIELPLEDHPGMVLELEWDTTFKGWVKRRGVKATIDIVHHTVVRQERR